MVSGFRQSKWLGRGSLVTACALLAVAAAQLGANSAPSSRIYFDPEAAQVELFEGMQDGSVQVKLVPKDSKGGVVFFQNKTDKPITVKLPEAVVASQVLKQGFGIGGAGAGMGAGGGLGQQGMGQGGMGGQAQSLGGGMGGMGGGMGGMGMGGMGMGGMGGMGGGFFSIPPEKSVRIPMRSVCLEYGKSEPRQRMVYELKPLDSFSEKTELHEMLKMFVKGKVDQDVAQAAAWHLASGMSWQELASKTIKRPGQNPIPLFTRAQLMAAQEFVATATGRARELEKNGGESRVNKKL